MAYEALLTLLPSLPLASYPLRLLALAQGADPDHPCDENRSRLLAVPNGEDR